MRLIDLEELKLTIRNDPNITGKQYAIMKRHMNEAAKIVICKECKFHENSDVVNRIWCRNMCRYMKEDGFCSEGEMEEG